MNINPEIKPQEERRRTVKYSHDSPSPEYIDSVLNCDSLHCVLIGTVKNKVSEDSGSEHNVEFVNPL